MICRLLRSSQKRRQHLSPFRIRRPAEPNDLPTENRPELQEGKIKLLAGGAVGGTYLLLEPIGRWPTGLAGAHSVQFIVPRHIPVPVGYRGHSGVYAEATGTCSSHFGLCSQISDGVFDQALKDAAPAASQD